MRRILFCLVLASAGWAQAQTCLSICTTRWDPVLLRVIVDCELRCQLPPDQNPQNNPEPIPTPGACGTAGFITNFRLEMTPFGSSSSSGSILNPTVGRWGNNFDFSGRVSGTLGSSPRVTISYNHIPTTVRHTTSYGHNFQKRVGTQPWGSSANFRWEVLASVDCDGQWEEVDRKFGEIDLKSSHADYERQINTGITKESSNRIIRLSTCTGGFHQTSQSHSSNHSFEVSSSIKGILQTTYGWSESFTLTQGTRINIPTGKKYDVMLDTFVTIYDIYETRYDWIGRPEPRVYSGRVLIRNLGLDLVDWANCN